MPEPSATVNPEAKAEEAYRLFVEDVSQDYVEALDIFAEQNLAAGEDPSLIFDEAWILQTTYSTVLIQDASNRILDRQSVPTRFQPYHNSFRDAAQLFSEAMVGYRTALDAGDANGLFAASDLITEASNIIVELTERAGELQ